MLTVRKGTVYEPEDLADEISEMLRRSTEMKALVRGRFEELGWKPGEGI